MTNKIMLDFVVWNVKDNYFINLKKKISEGILRVEASFVKCRRFVYYYCCCIWKSLIVFW